MSEPTTEDVTVPQQPGGPTEDAIRELTTQFYVTLRAYLARLHPNGDPRASAAYAKVKELLDPKRRASWSDCYEIEQLMVNLFDDQMLNAELQLRKIEAENLRPALAGYYRDAIQRVQAPDEQRALLVRLVNDLQWRYTVNESKRRFGRLLTSQTAKFFFVAFFAFSIATCVHWFALLPLPGDVRFFLLAAFAGTWGATFSMLTSLKSRIDASGVYELKASSAGTMLLSRALIGAGAAAILFFFFRSGLLQGPAFPDLSADAIAVAKDLSKPFALLVVWSFIAGFSEKLVPDLLSKTETRVDAPADRFRPPEPAPTPAAKNGAERAAPTNGSATGTSATGTTTNS